MIWSWRISRSNQLFAVGGSLHFTVTVLRFGIGWHTAKAPILGQAPSENLSMRWTTSVPTENLVPVMYSRHY